MARKPRVQAPIPQRVVHRRSRGRNENAICISRTKKYRKLANRRGMARGSGTVAKGFGARRMAASRRESTMTNRYGAVAWVEARA
jgi:hypothetical protein